jgi:hypothetical protein
MKFQFTKDFDFSPPAYRGMVTTSFKAGTTATVTHECAEAAAAAGAGHVVEPEATKPEPRARKSK